MQRPIERNRKVRPVSKRCVLLLERRCTKLRRPELYVFGFATLGRTVFFGFIGGLGAQIRHDARRSARDPSRRDNQADVEEMRRNTHSGQLARVRFHRELNNKR